MTLRSLRDVDPSAVCIDGTPSGYYWKPATTNASTWIVDLEGGYWCWGEEHCRDRCPPNSTKSLCSSSKWGTEVEHSGLLHPTQDDALEGANKVLVRYCTCDAHMGHAEAFGRQFRGARVLRAVFRDLVATHGLALGQQKDVVILGGQSAGGRGAMVNLDYVQEMVTAAGGGAVDVVGFLDSPYWVDMPNYPSYHGTDFATQCQNIFSYANVMNLGPECAEAHPGSEGWRCLMGQYRMPHIKESYFLIASQYDSFQLEARVGHKPASPDELAYAAAFAHRTKALVEQLHRRWPRGATRQNAIWSPACFDHACTLQRKCYEKRTCEGTSVDSAFRTFLGLSSIDGQASDNLWEDTCKGFKCGPGCHYKQIMV